MQTCHEMLAAFTDKVEQELTDVKLLNSLDFSPLSEGFHKVRLLSMDAIAELVLADVRPLLAGLGRPAWNEDQKMIAVLETVDDYFTDLTHWLLPHSFKKVCAPLYTPFLPCI